MHGINRSLKGRALRYIAIRVTILPLCVAAFIALGASGTARAAQTTIALDNAFYAAGPRLKLDHGFLVTWTPRSGAGPGALIEAFDEQGEQTMRFNLLDSLPDARKVVIADVSVSPGGLVAVGAQVFTAENNSELELLILDTDGHLYKPVEFDQGLGVLKVELDNDENIWVLRMGAGASDPAKVPVLSEYDRDGNLTGQFLHFSDFTKDAQIIHGGIALGGDVSMGVTGAHAWFWLPSSRELATLLKDGSGVQRTTTGLPPWPGTEPTGGIERARRCAWSETEGLLCQVTFLANPASSTQARTALCQFTNDTHEWQAVQQPELANHAGEFLGVDQNNVVFVTFDSRNHDIVLESVPTAP